MTRDQGQRTRGMTTIVIFGATGDLTARKLVPSLYRLDRKGRLPGDVRVVGVARTRLSDDGFRERLRPHVREFTGGDPAEGGWQGFARRPACTPGDAGGEGGLEGLKAWLAQAEGGGEGS